MIKQPKYLFFYLLILCVATLTRTVQLSERPMHTDEAVQGIKFGKLLEEGVYKYDPYEYHGPVLNYLTLIPAFIRGHQKLSSVDEQDLRIIPAFAGLGIVFLLFLYSPGLDNRTILFSALLISLSPIMVFYSRYYIMEMLLLFFSVGFIGCIYQYLRNPGLGWTIGSGVCLGLMSATKETYVLSVAAMALSATIMVFITKKKNGKAMNMKGMNPGHMLIMILIGLVVSFSFYSSFFTNLKGIPDSILTYLTYFERAGGNKIHEHPWYFYLINLFWTPGPGKLIWSEMLIVVLAIPAIISITARKPAPSNFLLFILFYSLILFIIYSLIPYKTPWNAIQFYFGWLILAGYGLKILTNSINKYWLKLFLILFLGFGITHYIIQMYLNNFVFYAQPSNPYVYGHTSRDIYSLIERVNKVAEIHPDGKNMYIEVIVPGHDYWPLPWYLRDFHKVGWWSEVQMDNPAGALIIASPSVEEILTKKLYEKPPPGNRVLYVPLMQGTVELRPHMEIRSYLQKDFWDKLYQYMNQNE